MIITRAELRRRMQQHDLTMPLRQITFCEGFFPRTGATGRFRCSQCGHVLGSPPASDDLDAHMDAAWRMIQHARSCPPEHKAVGN